MNFVKSKRERERKRTVNAHKMHKISQAHSERLNSPVNGRRNYYGKEKFEMKNRSTTGAGAATDAKREREKGSLGLLPGRNFFARIIKLTSSIVLSRHPPVSRGASRKPPRRAAIIVNVKFNVCARPMQSIRYCS